jgi:hypothetical protein
MHAHVFTFLLMHALAYTTVGICFQHGAALHAVANHSFTHSLARSPTHSLNRQRQLCAVVIAAPHPPCVRIHVSGSVECLHGMHASCMLDICVYMSMFMWVFVYVFVCVCIHTYVRTYIHPYICHLRDELTVSCWPLRFTLTLTLTLTLITATRLYRTAPHSHMSKALLFVDGKGSRAVCACWNAPFCFCQVSPLHVPPPSPPPSPPFSIPSPPCAATSTLLHTILHSLFGSNQESLKRLPLTEMTELRAVQRPWQHASQPCMTTASTCALQL